MSEATSIAAGPAPIGELRAAAVTLGRRYLLDFPREAAQQIERLPLAAAARLLAQRPGSVRVRCGSRSRRTSLRACETLLADTAALVLAEAEPAASAAALSQMDEAPREALLAGLQAEVGRELRELTSYPRDVAAI